MGRFGRACALIPALPQHTRRIRYPAASVLPPDEELMHRGSQLTTTSHSLPWQRVAPLSTIGKSSQGLQLKLQPVLRMSVVESSGLPWKGGLFTPFPKPLLPFLLPTPHRLRSASSFQQTRPGINISNQDEKTPNRPEKPPCRKRPTLDDDRIARGHRTQRFHLRPPVV